MSSSKGMLFKIEAKLGLSQFFIEYGAIRISSISNTPPFKPKPFKSAFAFISKKSFKDILSAFNLTSSVIKLARASRVKFAFAILDTSPCILYEKLFIIPFISISTALIIMPDKSTSKFALPLRKSSVKSFKAKPTTFNDSSKGSFIFI